MRISLHGNDAGYSLIDAAVSLFIASAVLLAVFSLLTGTVRFAAKTEQRIHSIIESKNIYAESVLTNAK